MASGHSHPEAWFWRPSVPTVALGLSWPRLGAWCTCPVRSPALPGACGASGQGPELRHKGQVEGSGAALPLVPPRLGAFTPFRASGISWGSPPGRQTWRCPPAGLRPRPLRQPEPLWSPRCSSQRGPDPGSGPRAAGPIGLICFCLSTGTPTGCAAPAHPAPSTRAGSTASDSDTAVAPAGLHCLDPERVLSILGSPREWGEAGVLQGVCPPGLLPSSQSHGSCVLMSPCVSLTAPRLPVVP